jgi:hypothetical protein
MPRGSVRVFPNTVNAVYFYKFFFKKLHIGIWVVASVYS